jgi:hypothetical protein
MELKIEATTFRLSKFCAAPQAVSRRRDGLFNRYGYIVFADDQTDAARASSHLRKRQIQSLRND